MAAIAETSGETGQRLNDFLDKRAAKGLRQALAEATDMVETESQGGIR